MESELFKIAASQGIWTALSVILIVYILKAQEKEMQTKKREKKAIKK